MKIEIVPSIKPEDAILPDIFADERYEYCGEGLCDECIEALKEGESDE